MVTCRDIITRALQQGRIVALGRMPSDKEAIAGLSALQGLYEGWITDGMFGRLTDIQAEDDYEANEGERITGATSLTLPTEIEADGGYRPPYELSVIVDVSNGANWLRVNGAWVNVAALGLNDGAPLANRDREGLASMLALYLVEGFGGDVGPMTQQRGLQFQSSLALKFGSTQAPRETDYF